ncbi:MAG TPA: S26 family signal peptidase [Streptosporangiaceae bacterium]|nr:S26 family signal peptidase [Streptosporangiaceae bacterium]
MTGSLLIAAGILALPLLAVAGAAWARRNLTLITVIGNSMRPAFADGDRLLISRRARYAAGDVIMFRAPEPVSHSIGWLVKRAVAMPGDPVPDDLIDRVGAGVVPAGQLLVRSDTLGGVDSRQFGLISASDVMGVVRRRRRFPAGGPAGPG